ncbi:MAG: DNA polymerase III subunit epsilon [Methylocystis sp.]|nr:DNA polymerase III subunit epsilon [Methylocystis sp.]MCA3583267.1 DNA polymerase III subunit epsilon [Methylocystis sp.]MCA3588052.1 DNA polymerase III subunit epsilon [Methylocystis sp.]MCA3591506.1 DNA polymerase III subunit epsilon [Methylocystis sp.]
MREIIFDTETTGLNPREGHRLVEIGCIEMVNRFPTGRVFHQYINPERDMPFEAFEVHGLSTEFLKDKPLFPAIADELWEFLDGAQLVAHNAGFDMGFINAEFERVKKPAISLERVVDTVQLARRKFPGAKASLDALCERFGISNAHRVKHGALLDAEILAEVYSELLGGKQAALGFDGGPRSGAIASATLTPVARPEPLQPLLTEAEIRAHAAFVAGMGEKALWKSYIERD